MLDAAKVCLFTALIPSTQVSMVDFVHLSELIIAHGRTLVIFGVPLKGSTNWPSALTLQMYKVNSCLMLAERF